MKAESNNQLDSCCSDGFAPREILGERGLRCTKQRAEIYDALRALKTHPTAEELFSIVRRTQPGISLATVYNTLEALCRCGLCRKLPCQDGVARYDAEMTDHVHVTTPAGEVHDVPEDLGDRLIRSVSPEVLAEVEQRLGVSIRQVRIELIGESGAD